MEDAPAGYRAVRWLAKEVSETWFREHGAIETDRIPEGKGVLFAAWHPGSLIDPLVMINNTINTGSTLHKFAIIPLLLQHKRIEMFNINNGIVALLFKRKWEFYGKRTFFFDLFFESF